MPRQRRTADRVCALVSGGVESAALVSHLLRRGDVVYPVYVESGYRWERAEIHWLRRLLARLASRRLKPLTRLSVPARDISAGSHWGFTGRKVPGVRSSDDAVYLPGRNLLLLSAASIFCARNAIGAIALGSLRGNPFRDASPGFLSRLERALAGGLGRPLRIEAPFRRRSKDQVVRRAGALAWRLTFSCLSPEGRRSCGRCNKCAERGKALSGLLASEG